MPTRIVMVKKIMMDGSPCRKCMEVEQRIKDGGYSQRIDEVVIYDERQEDSPGMKLAAEYGVTLAPFFVVHEESGSATVYKSWLRLEKEVLRGKVDKLDEAMDILDQDSSLDLL